MTEEKKIKLIDELADKCCKYHDVHKSCMNCWRRTTGCDKFILINKLVEEGCRIEINAKWQHYLSTPGGIHDKYKCTSCGYITGWTTKFCSECGATMKGD